MGSLRWATERLRSLHDHETRADSVAITADSFPDAEAAFATSIVDDAHPLRNVAH